MNGTIMLVDQTTKPTKLADAINATAQSFIALLPE
jgi:hypothetical protein